MVLYRKRATKKDAKKHLADTTERAPIEKRSKKINFLTYHASKGLQADAVFLLGDCEITSSSPSKNDFYAQAGMSDPTDPCGYDTAQQQEALRTAYVAISRPSHTATGISLGKKRFLRPKRRAVTLSRVKATGTLLRLNPLHLKMA
ncbi:3'-5' exonuclease [Pseudomonas fluorescens]|uniref:3'-5' exonuclease n=1 Tax=Pseudomonas fluorescens TaxID=294 RepID=UPI0038272F7B